MRWWGQEAVSWEVLVFVLLVLMCSREGGLCWTRFTKSYRPFFYPGAIEGAGLTGEWSLALGPARGGGKLVWAESTIGNWIVITAWLPCAIGGAEPFTEQSALRGGRGRDSIANPRWRAKEEEQQMGKFCLSLPFLVQMTLAAY